MDPNKNQSEELNVNDVFLSLSKVINKIGIQTYRFFKFLFQKKIIFLSLLTIGFFLGYFIDNYFQKNRFKHEIIVTPNVNSQSFLYKEIDNLKFTNKSAIKEVEIEPIVDIFNFISEKDRNVEIAKFLADNNVKLVKYSKGNETEQVYKYHIITFYSNNNIKAEKEINTILSNFNNEVYYKQKLKVNREYLNNKLKENAISIQNINNLFLRLGTNQPSTSSNVNIEVFTEINRLIENKQSILDENKKLENELIENKDVIFKLADLNANKESKSLNIKLILPLSFLLIFFGFYAIKNFSEKYKHLA